MEVKQTNNDKIENMIKRLDQYEVQLKDEKKVRMRLEEEVRNYRTIIVPTLEKNIEDKESLCKTAFIENIKLEKIAMNKLVIRALNLE